jgi:serine protease AprX
VNRRLVFTAPDSIPSARVDSLETDTTLSAYHATSLYGKAQRQIEMLNGQKLHQAGFQGQGMLIAIIDGGFMNADKIPLLKNVNVAGSRDCVYPYTANVYDLLDHGTMVLSTMGASIDSFFVGTAPRATYYLLRSEDGRTENLCEEDWWAQAAEVADSLGADVVNSSLGYTRFDDARASHTYREQDGRTALISRTASLMARKGMVLVNSAGNEGSGSWKRINFPGDADNILTVAALKEDSVNAPFSSVGPSIDGRVKPDVSAMGYMSTVIRGAGTVTVASGTSFSSPELCGMVACLWQALPNKTATEIIDLVRRAGDRYQWPDNVFGYGIPDFWKAYELGR